MYNKDFPYNDLPLIPPNVDFDNVPLLKLINEANNSIFELKGIMRVLPNSLVLMSPLITREAVSSSSIENINTTVEDVLKADAVYKESELQGTAKEVLNYKDSVFLGFKILKDKGFIGTNEIIDIQSVLEPNKQGIRNIPDVAIRSSLTKEKIYTPPEGKDVILEKLRNFDEYFNNKENFSDIDPLIRVAILHYQFEAIHPFIDGNGRTGRILMVLYLTLIERLDTPILFISKYILGTREEYYSLLKGVTENNNWLYFVEYIIKGIDIQAQETTEKIKDIERLMNEEKENAKNKNSSILNEIKMIEFLFSNPFYTTKRMSSMLGVHRNTASSNFKELERIGFLKKFKHKKENIYYNQKFLDLLK